MPEMTCPKCGTRMLSPEEVQKVRQEQSFMNVYVDKKTGLNDQVLKCNQDEVVLNATADEPPRVLIKKSLFKYPATSAAPTPPVTLVTPVVSSPSK